MYAKVLQFYTIQFQVDMLRDRSRNYLIMHLILGGAIFGISLAILGKICVSISYSYKLYDESVNTIFNGKQKFFLGMFLNFTTAFEPLTPHIIALFGLPTLNDVVFPFIGLAYLTSVVLTGIFSCCISNCHWRQAICFKFGVFLDGRHRKIICRSA